MIKTILKEAIIILLLCIAILIVLSILFYDYNPINKVIPNKIAYTTPENVKEELQEETIQTTLEVQNKVYTIEGSDLNIYKKSQSYDPSKDNPFATTAETDGGTTSVDNTTNSTKNNSVNNNSESNPNNTTKENTNNKGLK